MKHCRSSWRHLLRTESASGTRFNRKTPRHRHDVIDHCLVHNPCSWWIDVPGCQGNRSVSCHQSSSGYFLTSVCAGEGRCHLRVRHGTHPKSKAVMSVFVTSRYAHKYHCVVLIRTLLDFFCELNFAIPCYCCYTSSRVKLCFIK